MSDGERTQNNPYYTVNTPPPPKKKTCDSEGSFCVPRYTTFIPRVGGPEYLWPLLEAYVLKPVEALQILSSFHPFGKVDYLFRLFRGNVVYGRNIYESYLST